MARSSVLPNNPESFSIVPDIDDNTLSALASSIDYEETHITLPEKELISEHTVDTNNRATIISYNGKESTDSNVVPDIEAKQPSVTKSSTEEEKANNQKSEENDNETDYDDYELRSRK
eukprot:Ihof_evm5s104 gene=Ihof_evmTU5s104